MIPIPKEHEPSFKCNKNPVSPQLFLTEKRPQESFSPKIIDYGAPKTDRMMELLSMIDKDNGTVKKKPFTYKTMSTRAFTKEKSIISVKSKKSKKEDKFNDFIQQFDNKTAE
jgi:hypothetical protein